MRSGAKRAAGKRRRHQEDADSIEPLQFGELDLEPLPAADEALPSDEEHDRLGELPFVGKHMYTSSNAALDGDDTCILLHALNLFVELVLLKRI